MSSASFTAPSYVHLYAGIDPVRVNADDLADFLSGLFPSSTVDVRPEFFAHSLAAGSPQGQAKPLIAERLAQARVQRPDKLNAPRTPLRGEVDFEVRFLTAGVRKPAGLLYDAYVLIGIHAELLHPAEAAPEHCHIALTNQLFGTWDPSDCRYHARAAAYGVPSLISTTGLVEAPAKPRAFYLARSLGVRAENVQGATEEQWLTHDDPRMQDVMKGYLLQALFYHVTGNPFCDDVNCRLFNAHWQRDLIHAQTRPKADLCQRHRNLLRQWA